MSTSTMKMASIRESLGTLRSIPSNRLVSCIKTDQLVACVLVCCKAGGGAGCFCFVGGARTIILSIKLRWNS